MGRFQITWLISYNLLGLLLSKRLKLFLFPSVRSLVDGDVIGNGYSETDKAFLLIDNFFDMRRLLEVIICSHADAHVLIELANHSLPLLDGRVGPVLLLLARSEN